MLMHEACCGQSMFSREKKPQHRIRKDDKLTSTIILQLLQGPIWPNNSKMRASVTSLDRFPTYLSCFLKHGQKTQTVLMNVLRCNSRFFTSSVGAEAGASLSSNFMKIQPGRETPMVACDLLGCPKGTVSAVPGQAGF